MVGVLIRRAPGTQRHRDVEGRRPRGDRGGAELHTCTAAVGEIIKSLGGAPRRPAAL